MVPKGTRVFGSIFVDELKMAEKELRRKRRLVAQNYRDEGATETMVRQIGGSFVRNITKKVGIIICSTAHRAHVSRLKDDMERRDGYGGYSIILSSCVKDC